MIATLGYVGLGLVACDIIFVLLLVCGFITIGEPAELDESIPYVPVDDETLAQTIGDNLIALMENFVQVWNDDVAIHNLEESYRLPAFDGER